MKHELTLSLEPNTFALDIGGNTANADVAISMLDMARRYFEGQVRKSQALQMQREMAEQVECARIAASVGRH